MKMNKPSKGLLIMVAVVVLFWCVPASAQDVRYNFVAGTNFAQYKTYKWVRLTKGNYPNQIADGQIMQSIDKQLALKPAGC